MMRFLRILGCVGALLTGLVVTGESDWGGTVSIALGDLNRDGIADLGRYHQNGHFYIYPGRGSAERGTAFWAPRDHGGDWVGTVSISL
jgi:hypothetical protein